MGKRIITQRRGRGTSTYRAHSFRKKYVLSYPKLTEQITKGTIQSLEHDQGRETPLAIIQFDNNSKICVPAPEGVRVGQDVEYGKINPDSLSITEIGEVPDGKFICNIEKAPGSGGIFCRAPGSFAKVISKKEKAIIQFSSKKQKALELKCRVILGVVAGGGKLEKPVVKAGKKHHMMKSKGKLYPKTSGVAMNAVDHPFGSGRGRHIGKSKIAPRNAPPGRNVGLIRPKRTGKKK